MRRHLIPRAEWDRWSGDALTQIPTGQRWHPGRNPYHPMARPDRRDRNRKGPLMTDTRIKTAVGPTILLHSGSYFDLLDPHGSDFTIEDIAHGLSNTCRFAGQCRWFYSVAEHSWHASHLVSPAFALRALMHHAAEAFIGDVTRPLKSLLPEYKAIERNVEAAVMARFGIDDWNVDEVKQADLLMLHVEQAAMMPRHADRWSTSEGLPDNHDVQLRFWDPTEARTWFLTRFEWLMANGGQG